jgi:predicted alpha-1,2-mannosidase
VVVINDAYRKGIRGYDVDKAYQYSINTMNKFGNNSHGYSVSNGFPLSETLEYANDDWNMSQFALAMGKSDDAAKYAKRSQTYRSVFDPNAPWTYDEAGKDSNPNWKGWFRARGANGEFLPWNGLKTEKTCQEASVYQQGWLVPYDVPGLMNLLGGRDQFLAKLSDFFDRTPNAKNSNPFYNQPNEPVHLIPFMFNRAGAPWLTQKWVRTIDKAYGAGPDGLCGDEDVGQMSAWYVLAASGLHPACPGEPRYEIFTPLFDKINLRLDPAYAKGKVFTITAQNNSNENIYIQSATLNGKPLDRCWLSHEEITAGGELGLVLGPKPNEKWGIERVAQ